MKDPDYRGQETGLPAKELETKMYRIKEQYIDLASEFTRILNDRGISGSIIEFNVHDRPFDDLLSWVQDDKAKVGLGCWTCPPDCVCCGIKGHFVIEPSSPANPDRGQSVSARFDGSVEIIEDVGSPYNPADYFRSYDGKVSGAGAVILYKYVREISTLGIEFESYPDKRQLPAILRSEDAKFSVALRSDSSGALHLSALMEVEHAVCNNKKCSQSQTYCVTSPLWRCYCTYFNGVSQCHHEPCPTGGGGGVEPGAVDFTAVVPGGKW